VKNWGFLFRGFCSEDFVLWFSFFGSCFSVLGLVARLLGCMVTWNIGRLELWSFGTLVVRNFGSSVNGYLVHLLSSLLVECARRLPCCHISLPALECVGRRVIERVSTAWKKRSSVYPSKGLEVLRRFPGLNSARQRLKSSSLATPDCPPLSIHAVNSSLKK